MALLSPTCLLLFLGGGDFLFVGKLSLREGERGINMHHLQLRRLDTGAIISCQNLHLAIILVLAVFCMIFTTFSTMCPALNYQFF